MLKIRNYCFSTNLNELILKSIKQEMILYYKVHFNILTKNNYFALDIFLNFSILSGVVVESLIVFSVRKHG